MIITKAKTKSLYDLNTCLGLFMQVFLLVKSLADRDVLRL